MICPQISQGQTYTELIIGEGWSTKDSQRRKQLSHEEKIEVVWNFSCRKATGRKAFQVAGKREKL
jgi:hypothetical protein